MHSNDSDARTSGIREHRKLRELLGVLQTCARTQLGVLRALLDVQAHLQHHFASEEQAGGLFDIIRSVGSWHSERADGLQREHRSLLASIDFIASRIDDLDPNEAWSEIEHFIALMRAHEISEGVLYQDAMQELRSKRSNVIHLDERRGTKRARSMKSGGAKTNVDARRQPRLLLLEDEENNGRVLSRMLREDGFDVEVMYDEEEAISHLSLRELPDAIVSSVLSGHLDGRAVAAFARSRDPNVPIVFITAYPHLVNSGPNRLDPPAIVYNKPVDYRALIHQLSALLGGGPHAHRRTAAEK